MFSLRVAAIQHSADHLSLLCTLSVRILNRRQTNDVSRDHYRQASCCRTLSEPANLSLLNQVRRML